MTWQISRFPTPEIGGYPLISLLLLASFPLLTSRPLHLIIPTPDFHLASILLPSDFWFRQSLSLPVPSVITYYSSDKWRCRLATITIGAFRIQLPTNCKFELWFCLTLILFVSDYGLCADNRNPLKVVFWFLVFKAPEEYFKVHYFYVVVDAAIVSLNTSFEILKHFENIFGFLYDSKMTLT